MAGRPLTSPRRAGIWESPRVSAAAVALAIAGVGAIALAQPVKPPPPVFEDPLPPVEAPRPEPGPLAPQEDGPSYPFERLVVEYGPGYPQPIPIETLLAGAQVDLRLRDGVYSVHRDGEAPAPFPLAELASLTPTPRRISAGAINEVCRSLVIEMNRRGLIGVRVSPDPAQIDLRTLADLRDPKTEATIRILVLPAWVSEVNVLATPIGDEAGEPAPSERLQWIADGSPLQSGLDGAPGDALNRDAIEEYVRAVSRHPNRRADASISPAGPAGDVTLDYLVTERKPWSLLFEISNTGTENTGDLRQRVGYSNTQLTGNDDILTLDFITADFDETNALLASYEAPVSKSDRLRWRAYGNWQEYTASDLGFGSAQFSGDGWTLGGALVWNFLQKRDLFLDLVAGARFEWQDVSNEISGTDGDAGFFVPYIGLDLEKYTPTGATRASLRFEWSLSNLLGGGDDNLDDLGRPDTDDNWVVLKYDLTRSLFLEPLFYRSTWSDPDKPGPHTLAHEVVVGVRGQYAFDYRLAPQAQSVVGGLYTVRGYPEAVTAGDSTIIATLEYRFHLPRTFSIQPDPSTLFGRPFRAAPDRPFGLPDWDLVLKAFIDVGRSVNSDRQPGESDDTLVGTGVGAELVLWQNLSVRVDWGIALEDVPGEVSSGSNRVNFVVTIQF